MTPIALDQAFNKIFRELQETVPYSTPNRDGAMCSKYAQYIGVLECQLKLYMPKGKYEEMVENIRKTMEYIR